jgi:hypothetical protein
MFGAAIASVILETPLDRAISAQTGRYGLTGQAFPALIAGVHERKTRAGAD